MRPKTRLVRKPGESGAEGVVEMGEEGGGRWGGRLRGCKCEGCEGIPFFRDGI